MSIEVNLNEFIEARKHELNSFKKELSTLPAGQINIDRRKDKTLIYRSVATRKKSKKGKTVYKRTTINNDKQLQQLLCRKLLLSEKIKRFNLQLKLLKQLCKKYPDSSDEAIIDFLHCKYSFFPSDYFLEHRELSEWATNYKQKPFRENEKKFHVCNDIYVRSKSELIIVLLLLKYNVDFRYEDELTIDGQVYHPDFTIRKPDGTIIYWEHCGMPSVSAYWARHKKKLAVYEKAGIFPFSNLIVTYDNVDGSIDQAEIEHIILTRILN